MTTIKKKAVAPQYLFVIIAAVLAIAMVLLFSDSRRPVREQAVIPASSFDNSNYAVMKKDTFLALVSKAYGSRAVVTHDEQALYIDIKNAGPSARDFFDGNDLLLDYKMSDFGFEIKYDREKQAVHAAFNINAKNGINVPDDMLMKLMEKTYNK